MPEELDQHTFKEISGLVYDRVGVVLGPRKEALVSARVGKRMRRLGIGCFREYLEHMRNDATGAELVELINAICTNVTSFFREERHFQQLTEILQQWEAQGQHRFRIWCAAASTGEEPYTLAMTVREALRDPSDCRILATDVSTRALAAARQGQYREVDIERVPGHLRARYFSRERRNGTTVYQVSPELASMIQFGRINLATPPFPLKGPLDVVFCRNVMIYFDNPVRKRLLDEMSRLLRRGGYLMVGHSESLSGMLSDLKSVQPATYRKP